jgi:hypothetical protein
MVKGAGIVKICGKRVELKILHRTVWMRRVKMTGKKLHLEERKSWRAPRATKERQDNENMVKQKRDCYSFGSTSGRGEAEASATM